MNKPKRPAKTKKIVLLSVLILALAIGAGLWYRTNNQSTAPPTTTNPTETEKVNLSPATEQEKRETEQHKDALVEQQNQPAPTPGTKKDVTPVITFASKTEVRAYVSGVFEDEGTCTAIATQGSKTVRATSEGFKNVSTTQCAPIAWATPLGSGSWKITVSYDSSTAEGTSSAQEVQ